MEMEKVAKKLRTLIKGLAYLLRKGLSNSKLLLEFSSLLVKRTHKLIGKLALQNDVVFAADYEFSCSNTPVAAKRSSRLRRRHHYDAATFAAINQVLDMINGGGDGEAPPESPALGLPGFFDRSPAAARQLRITDSPFPAKESDENEEVKRVNKAADEFIRRFYMDLRHQKALALDSPYHHDFS